MTITFKFIIHVLFVFSSSIAISQTLPSARVVDWTTAGLQNLSTSGFDQIDMTNFNVNGDGITANDNSMSNALASISGSGAILIFPNGNFLFNNAITLSDNVILRGSGVNNTTLSMNLGGSGHGISITGIPLNSIISSFTQPALKFDNSILVDDASTFSTGDWIQIIQNDLDLITSSWADDTVGQIVKIENIDNNQITLTSELRMDYDLARSPYIKKIQPVENVGIECLKIVRLDNTVPVQTSNIFFDYAVNCWVSGIESDVCNYSHIEAKHSSNIYITKSYIHHGFDYDGGGRAYGVLLHHASNECLVEDNIFEHLRHSMLVQAGANGNVFAFNYSFDPFWSSTPSNSAGDIVLHGNYVYSNLFEQNIVQNIVIDNSHGPNGPYNTFLRNRAESYGIFFSASNSPDQNFLGNDITNTSFPYSVVNYNIQGTGHFIHGNNNKGVIDPSGTTSLPDLSYAYIEQPDFVESEQWAAIGTPNSPGAASIPSRDRLLSNSIFDVSCSSYTLDVEALEFERKKTLAIFPNPTNNVITIKSDDNIQEIVILNPIGQVQYINNDSGNIYSVDLTNWNSGIYLVRITYKTNFVELKRILKY